MGRRERYLEERDKENGVLSYDALDQNGMVGPEIFDDPILRSEAFCGMKNSQVIRFFRKSIPQIHFLLKRSQ